MGLCWLLSVGPGLVTLCWVWGGYSLLGLGWLLPDGLVTLMGLGWLLSDGLGLVNLMGLGWLV